MDREEAIRAHYERRIRPWRPDHLILDWASSETQRKRFDVLIDRVDLAGRSLLDVGCGLGSLWGCLKERHISVRYTGVDILAKMVRAAWRRHPDAQFVCADVFRDDAFGPDSFDVVYCSGAMNLDLGNNLRFIARAAARFLHIARDRAVFNLLHRRASGGPPGPYFYTEPGEVRPLLKDLPCEAAFVDDYLPNDFTVICTKRRPASGP